MSYKLYTDKKENFECQIYLEGASLSQAKTRLIIENGDLNIMFNGEIDKKGKCQIPIKKLKGLLDENDVGIIRLEVIAEDTYFQPWQSEFIVETAKKIKVKVKEQQKKNDDWMTGKPSKPKVLVSEVKNYLISQNIKVKNFISGRNITNWNNDPGVSSGTWVFSLDNGKPPVVKSMYESVSIPQEETKAESPRAKTRRKKTTKTKEA